MTVGDNVYSAIGPTKTCTPALIRYTEITPKMFLISLTGSELEPCRCIHETALQKDCNSYDNKQSLSVRNAHKFPFPKLQSEQHYGIS